MFSLTNANGYVMNFSQDYKSITVLGKKGFRLYSINATNQVNEIYAKDSTEQIRIVERLLNTSLLALVTQQKPKCLKLVNFKEKRSVWNHTYNSDILCVRMNRQRLVTCLGKSIHIHDMAHKKILHTIVNIAPNEYGLCALSLNSFLAYPICTNSGILKIYNAHQLKTGVQLNAHVSRLTAMNFSTNGTLLATASERGTVIRVFCVKNGQRVQECRRGFTRSARIASLVFSTNGDFLCTTSNTETVHIYKIDVKAVEAAKLKPTIASEDASSPPSTSSREDTSSSSSSNIQPTNTSSRGTTSTTATSTTTTTEDVATNASNRPIVESTWTWKGAISYVVPALAQDRDFATATLDQPGLKHVCGLTRIQKDFCLLIACEDGFLNVYDFNSEKGGSCSLLFENDLRSTLEDVEVLKLSDSMDKVSVSDGSAFTPTTNPTANISNDLNHSNDSTSVVSNSPHNKSSSSSSVIIISENPESCSDSSYAGIVRGCEHSLNTTSTMTDSAKFRILCDAIDTPTKLYDELQFPPVAIAAKD